MKTVLVVLLILAAGAGAWFSGLSGLFGINGQYQDFKEMISYRKTLDKEIRTWTSLRNDMIKNRGLAAEENLSLISNKASVTQQRDEQLSKEAELKEEEVQLNADLSKINKQIEELKSKLQDFGVSSVQEIQEKMESLEASNKKLQEDIDQIKSATEVASKRRAEQASELASRQKEQAEYRAALAKNGEEYPVLSVDPQWGFVVIGAGQGSSIDPNTVLLVTREGRSIGKLKVTSLEKNQTVADIIKDSVPSGMSIQPGDRVHSCVPVSPPNKGLPRIFLEPRCVVRHNGVQLFKGNDETICNLLFVCVFFYSSGLFLFLVDGTAGEGACAAAASRSGKECASS